MYLPRNLTASTTSILTILPRTLVLFHSDDGLQSETHAGYDPGFPVPTSTRQLRLQAESRERDDARLPHDRRLMLRASTAL